MAVAVELDRYGVPVSGVRETDGSLAAKTVSNLRCRGVGKDGRTCGRLLAELVTAPWRLRCPRCKTLDTGGPVVG